MIIKSLGLLILLFISYPAFSFLGEAKESALKNELKIGLKVESTQTFNNYQVITLSKPTLTLKEYVDLAGRVFAVSWTGKVPPDLNLILGSYLAEYKSAFEQSEKQPGHARYSSLSTNNIVVEKSQVAHTSRGRAYIVKLLPVGVSVNAIN